MKSLLYKFILLFWIIPFCSCEKTLDLIAQDGRSTLYPEEWFPGYTDNEGRFLHDFSYAGYHAGEQEIPANFDNIIDVTESPYNADSTGKIDVTSIIQQALDDVGQMGGGVVFLPEGTYIINAEKDNKALHIKNNNVVLRGAGPTKTRLINTTSTMRNKSIILVDGQMPMRWNTGVSNIVGISENLDGPTMEIPVKSTAGFSRNDMIVIISDVTEAFIDDHNMNGHWNTEITGPLFYRRIVGIDHEENVLFIDSPIRYWLKLRDNPRVYKVNDPTVEVGIENFSIGNYQNISNSFDLNDFRITGTGGYETHNSYVIRISGCLNSWVSRVSTFRPSFNHEDIHILSNGILIEHSANITIEHCDFQKSQFNGHGGNGYMFVLEGNNCLLRFNTAGYSRHNYSFKRMSSNGNVIYRCTGNASLHASDFHMQMSMANLIDNFNVNGDYLSSRSRIGIGTHGHTTTESVYWNTNGIRYGVNPYIILSQQFGHGYIIGTRGPASNVRVLGGDGTGHVDFTEGIGAGSHLIPHSLYTDQLRRRLNREITSSGY